MNADLAIIRGVETLHVVDDLSTMIGRKILEWRVVDESNVRTLPRFEGFKELECALLFVAFLDFSVFMAHVCAVHLVGLEVSFLYEPPQLRWATMDELGSEFQDLISFAKREDAAAHAIPCFEHHDMSVSFGKFSRRGQARHACSNDQDALALTVHGGLDAKTRAKPSFVARLVGWVIVGTGNPGLA